MKMTNEIREHLRFLEVDGRLTPERVVEDARRPESPLHAHFEWDTDKAAGRYWLDQARELIRTVQVQLTVNEITIKAPFYVPDPSRVGKEQGYTNLDALRMDPSAARQSLISECERAASVLRRARLIATALDLSDQVDTVLGHVAGLRSLAENTGDNLAAA